MSSDLTCPAPLSVSGPKPEEAGYSSQWAVSLRRGTQDARPVDRKTLTG
jgi:hypothetical protein